MAERGPTCSHCGYDLSGVPVTAIGVRCPECATTFELRTPKPAPPPPRFIPHCPKCDYDLSGTPLIDGHVRCPECGARIKNGEVERPIGARLRCPICSYDLYGLPVLANRVQCPECGRASTQRDIDLANPIPGFGKALAMMCLPSLACIGAALALKVTKPSWGEELFEGIFILAAVAWSLLAPAMIARSRAAANARGTRVAIDEAVTGYVITLVALILCIGLYMAA